MSKFDTTLQHWSYNRQNLGKQSASAAKALEDVIAVYSAHPSGPLSLFARVKSLNQTQFLKLDRDKLAVRMPAMRLTVHMMPVKTAPMVFAATVPPASDPIWEKRYGQKGRNIPKGKYDSWQRQVLKIAKEPVLAKEIEHQSDIAKESLKPVLNRMAFAGVLLRVGAGSPRSNAISYVSADSWLGKKQAAQDREKAQRWLAEQYLKAFGPARVKDFQWWAGVSASEAKESIGGLNTIDVENGHLLLKKDEKAYTSFKPPKNDGIDILPQWDCYTMGYAPDGRARIVSPDMQDQVYGKIGATVGNALGSILVNGLAHGTWSHRFKGNTLQIDLKMFEKISGKVNAAIKERFSEIAAFLGANKLDFGR
jgi:hypothetical protein